MSKGTETQLSELHGIVAEVLRKQLEETVDITNEETGVTETVMTATPATLGVAIKFLKDNDITSSIEDDDNLQELDELLKKKREGRGLRLAAVNE